MKILVVFGTRPEAIKMSLLAKKLQEQEWAETRVCVTAQHREMLDQVLEIFELEPEYDLDIMQKNQTLADITARILTGMTSVLQEFKPDICLVHGDTSTTFAASLACFYEGVKVGHVEAGLRTWNINSPWPEEGNRQLTAKLTEFHFAPTELAKENLLLERTQDTKVFVTGNTVIDSLLWVQEKIKSNPAVFKKIVESYTYLNRFKGMILITGHRRENFGDGFLNICHAIAKLAKDFPEHAFIYPVHLNPNVKKPVNEILSGKANIFLIEPLEYLEFVYFMEKSTIILTDSGGIQEEAPSLGKPVLVMRETTERPEAVDAGTVKLVGTSVEKIKTEATKLLLDNNAYQEMSYAHNPYGDGTAVEKIITTIKRVFDEK